jgi:putative tryptophan/tyrosine transport system substrate-binding protein
MRRRDFISFVGSVAAAWTPVAPAQPQSGKVPRIGFLARTSAASLSVSLDSFRQGLAALGWIEGSNLGIEYQFGDGALDQLAELAAALVRLDVDMIVTVDTPATLAAKRATSTLPIIIAASADPVAAGLVASLAHPGGNITGLSLLSPDTDQKELEFAKEMLPDAERVAVVWDPDNPAMPLRMAAVKVAAAKLPVDIQLIAAPNEFELVDALKAAAENPPAALIVNSPVYTAYRPRIVDFTTRTGVPLIFDTKGLAGEPGALLSYGADLSALFSRSATYVDKILKGARPADLPVEQPTVFELVINLRNARSKGITVPELLLARADEVIE